MFTHVLYINLQVMTPIQINVSDCTVCKWILWLEASEPLQMTLKALVHLLYHLLQTV